MTRTDQNRTDQSLSPTDTFYKSIGKYGINIYPFISPNLLLTHFALHFVPMYCNPSFKFPALGGFAYYRERHHMHSRAGCLQTQSQLRGSPNMTSTSTILVNFLALLVPKCAQFLLSANFDYIPSSSVGTSYKDAALAQGTISVSRTENMNTTRGNFTVG